MLFHSGYSISPSVSFCVCFPLLSSDAKFPPKLLFLHTNGRFAGSFNLRFFRFEMLMISFS